MSHFTVLVVGEDPEKQLAPFQENNMGDCPPAYMEFNDMEPECRKEWEEEKHDKLKGPDGKLHSPYDDQFKRPKKNPKDFFEHQEYDCPDGYEKVQVPVKELYPDFDKYMTEYHGYKKDSKLKKYGYYENPNAKWDWYQLGGRWTGMFRLRNDNSKGDLFTDEAAQLLAAQYSTTKEEVKAIATIIKSGDEEARFKRMKDKPIAGGYHLEKAIRELVTQQYPDAKCGSQGLGTRPPEEGYVDQAYKRDIDFQGMRDEAADKAAIQYDKVARIFGGEIPQPAKSWQQMLAIEMDHDKRRAEYHAQPELQRVKELEKIEGNREVLGFFFNFEDYAGGREAYIGRAIRYSVGTFAVIKDGKWYERGSMGWWGCVSDEKEGGDWASQIKKLLDEVPDDTLLSVYDCHI